MRRSVLVVTTRLMDEVETRIDRDYEALRVGMQTLFGDLGLTTSTRMAA